MRFCLLNESLHDQYEAFIRSFNDALLYHSIKYKLFIEELLECQSAYCLMIGTNDEILGAMPLMIKHGKYGKILNALPFYGSHGSIFSDNAEVYQALLNCYITLGNKYDAATFIENPLSTTNHQFLIHSHYHDKRIGQWTNIENEEILFNSFESSARRNIKKAIQYDVKVDVDNTCLEFLHKIHKENILSIGGLPKEERFFNLLNKHFIAGTDYNIYVAYYNNQLISALLIFYYNNTVEYFIPATVAEYRHVQALPLIIYQGMIDASKRGYKWWNWGGTWLSQTGVYKFKRKFGAKDMQYHYHVLLNKKSLLEINKEALLDEYRGFYIYPFNLT